MNRWPLPLVDVLIASQDQAPLSAFSLCGNQFEYARRNPADPEVNWLLKEILGTQKTTDHVADQRCSATLGTRHLLSRQIPFHDVYGSHLLIFDPVELCLVSCDPPLARPSCNRSSECKLMSGNV